MTTSKKRTVSEIMKTEKKEEVAKKSAEIAAWIESQLKEKLPKPNLRESLLDGVVLCKLINALAPGALKRYHKKPRMLAMKIENIGFFLATCKTRMNLPPALLFQPTDIHDDSNDLASMSKVLNVLSFLKGDGEGDMIQALPDEDDDEEGGGAAETKPPDDLDPDIEPEPDNLDDELELEELPPPVPVATPAPTPTPAPVATATKTAPPAAASHTSYSSGVSDPGDVQVEVLKAIVEVINAELSIESRKNLLKTLQHQISSFETKLITSSDDQLVALARDSGIDEVSKVKGRDAIVDLLLKYVRVQ